MNKKDYNSYLAEDLAFEIFAHEMPGDPSELAQSIEAFLNARDKEDSLEEILKEGDDE